MSRPSCYSWKGRPNCYIHRAAVLAPLLAMILIVETFGGGRASAQTTEAHIKDQSTTECLSDGHRAASEGNFDQAVNIFGACVEKHPNSPEALYFLGMAHLKKEDIHKATSAFKKAVQLDPNNIDSMAMLGKIYSLDKQKLALARELLERVLSVAPHKDDVRFVLARVYGLAGDKDTCFKQFQIIFNEAARYGVYHFEFAKMLIADGERKAAQVHLDRALALAPDFEPAKRLRESLEKESKEAEKPAGDRN